jgi:hypothetical protein
MKRYRLKTAIKVIIINVITNNVSASRNEIHNKMKISTNASRPSPKSEKLTNKKSVKGEWVLFTI